MTEDLLNQNHETEAIVLDQRALANIYEARKWTLFLSVMGFIGVGIFFFVFLAMMFGASFLGGLGALALIPGLLLMAVYVIPIYYLYQFSVVSKSAILTKQSHLMAGAFNYLKRHYRFMGILLIIAIVLNLVVLLEQLAFLGSFLMVL